MTEIPSLAKVARDARTRAIESWPVDHVHVNVVWGVAVTPYSKIGRGRYPEGLRSYEPEAALEEGPALEAYKMRYPSTVTGNDPYLLICGETVDTAEAVSALQLLPVPEIVQRTRLDWWPTGIPQQDLRQEVVEALERYLYELALFSDQTRASFSRLIRRRYVLS